MFANLVAETSTSTGTGDFTLDGAITGRRTFNAQFGTGTTNPVRYVIDDGAGNFEIGESYLSDSTTLVRGGSQRVDDSSNSGSPVNFGSGEKSVYCDAATADILAEATRDHGNVGSGTLTLDARFGWHQWTVTGDHTVAFSDWPVGARTVQALIKGAVSYSLTWPSAVKWDGGAAPLWSPTVGGSPGLSAASYDSVSFSVSGQDGSPFGIAFKENGTKMYVLGLSTDSVYQYTLSTAWDLSTASYDSVSFSVSGQDGSPLGIAFKEDGTKMYMLGSSTGSVYQYSVTLTGGTPQSDIAEFVSPDQGATIYGRRVWAEA